MNGKAEFLPRLSSKATVDYESDVTLAGGALALLELGLLGQSQLLINLR